jgi:uncharacterized protein (TIGR01440 family)
MSDLDLSVITGQVEQIVRETAEAGRIGPGQLLVIGASTSEVIGKRIGTSGATEIAEAIFAGVEAVSRQFGFWPVFQCCEHLNRSLVMEREAMAAYRFEEVTAVPVPKAGGAMAAFAYRKFRQPCLVEAVRAHAGVDIGETLIGMHLKPVAVPFRPSIRYVGEARVTAAFTRPKLIGGERAVYKLADSVEERC